MVNAIILFPIATFVILIFFGSKVKVKAPIISIGALFGSFVLSVMAAIQTSSGKILEVSYPWLGLASFSLKIDQLAAGMLVLITGVGILVQLYSVAYMRGDIRFSRYFAYLSLFCAAMLGLVLSNNLILFYIFWELVGLGSYLLIGFWFEKPSAASAAKKAFIFTRIGDVGLFLGILLISFKVGSLDIATILGSAGTLSTAVATTATLLLFCGAIGKSAQFPLHVWLPDAMEGPTPVSALIHAATMVAAGVYMVARFFPLFEHAPFTLLLIGYVGIGTALLAGLIAVTQNDIKKILAYSTISQLGFMFLAMGSLNPEGGIFHLLSHGLFKALLFLGAGSIIHATHTNDIRKMSGLKKTMPITFVTFLIGTLALAGIPPFAGFFSKDAVMAGAYHHLPLGFALALPAIFLTAFYMFRLYFKIFPGNPSKSRESEPIMTIPLIILAVLTTIFGFIYHPAGDEGIELAVLIPSLGMALLGITTAWILYGLKLFDLSKINETFLYKIVANKFYLDDFYNNILGHLSITFSHFLALFDKNAVDGIVNLLGGSTIFISQKIRKMQTGFAQNYLLFGVVGIVIIILLKR